MNLFNGEAIWVVARQELGTIDSSFDRDKRLAVFHAERRRIRRDDRKSAEKT
jgi:hypothetical protein